LKQDSGAAQQPVELILDPFHLAEHEVRQEVTPGLSYSSWWKEMTDCRTTPWTDQVHLRLPSV